MGLLGLLITNVALRSVETAAACGAIYMEHKRSVSALVDNSDAKQFLFIKKKSMSIKRGFAVLDESNKKKYIVKTAPLTFGYPCIRLYDTSETEIGKVKLTSKIGMGTYTVYLGGKALGTLTRKMSVKVKLDLDFNGWHLDGNLMQNSFTVTDNKGNTVLKFNDAFSSRDTYVLEFNNCEHEIMGLLLVMAVELALHGND